MAKKEPPLSEQSERFIRTARELGCDEDPEAFERAFARVVPPKRPPGPVPQNAKRRRRLTEKTRDPSDQ